MKIVHAVCDENGEAHGGIPGDQTGKEIREQNWYNRSGGGWEQYIECTDQSIADKAVAFAKAICAGNYGYNQDKRWSGYDSILADGIENGCGDFDCSSLVLGVYRLAGLNIKEKSGSTRDAAKILTATGKFRLVTEGDVLTNPELAKKGSCYCTPGQHIVVCIEDGKKVEITQDSSDDPIQSVTARQIIRIRKNKDNVRIRETPKTGKTVVIAHAGDIIEVYGTDVETGWYKTASGYITNNERYIEKI